MQLNGFRYVHRVMQPWHHQFQNIFMPSKGSLVEFPAPVSSGHAMHAWEYTLWSFVMGVFHCHASKAHLHGHMCQFFIPLCNQIIGCCRDMQPAVTEQTKHVGSIWASYAPPPSCNCSQMAKSVVIRNTFGIYSHQKSTCRKACCSDQTPLPLLFFHCGQ